jgi:hypothetical protein
VVGGGDDDDDDNNTKLRGRPGRRLALNKRTLPMYVATYIHTAYIGADACLQDLRDILGLVFLASSTPRLPAKRGSRAWGQDR